MQPTSTKWKWIHFVIALSFCLTALLDPILAQRLGRGWRKVDAGSLATLKVILVPLAAFYLVIAALLPLFRKAILDRLGRGRRLVPPDTTFRLMGYVALVAPVMFAQILYRSGMAVQEYFCMVGISVAATLAWGTYDLRTHDAHT